MSRVETLLRHDRIRSIREKPAVLRVHPRQAVVFRAPIDMATQADVRRIAMKFPDVEEGSERFAFSVPNKGKLKGFVWVWMERIEPKKPRVANRGVIAARVANVAQRDMMIAAEPAKFFTEPHYNGFPAVLVRLEAVSAADLKVIIEEAYRCQAPVEPAPVTKRAGKKRPSA
jgi:hypothetical protein